METPAPDEQPRHPDEGAPSAAALLLDSADWQIVSPASKQSSKRSSVERARSTAVTPTKARDALDEALLALQDAESSAAAAHKDAYAAIPCHEAQAEVGDPQEVVGVHSLQGLSQEGSLEGFAVPEAPHALNADAPTPAGHAADHAAPGGNKGNWWLVGQLVDALLGLDTAAPLHLRDALVKLLGEGLGWARGHLLEACRAGLESLQLYLALTQKTLAFGAQGAAAAHAQLARALGRAHTLMLRRAALMLPTTSPARCPEEGEGAGDLKASMGGTAAAPAARLPPALRANVLVVSALGLTSLASLAGVIFFYSRCRQLTTQLQQRDRELARLVVKILNLQDALQSGPRGGVPVLRQTTLLAGLV